MQWGRLYRDPTLTLAPLELLFRDYTLGWRAIAASAEALGRRGGAGGSTCSRPAPICRSTRRPPLRRRAGRVRLDRSTGACASPLPSGSASRRGRGPSRSALRGASWRRSPRCSASGAATSGSASTRCRSTGCRCTRRSTTSSATSCRCCRWWWTTRARRPSVSRTQPAAAALGGCRALVRPPPRSARRRVGRLHQRAGGLHRGRRGRGPRRPRGRDTLRLARQITLEQSVRPGVWLKNQVQEDRRPRRQLVLPSPT